MGGGKRVRRNEFKAAMQRAGLWERYLAARAAYYARGFSPRQAREHLFPAFERLYAEAQAAGKAQATGPAPEAGQETGSQAGATKAETTSTAGPGGRGADRPPVGGRRRPGPGVRRRRPE